MQKALLSLSFQHTIPGFPRSTGHEVINFFQSCRHPRDAVVLCRSEDANGEEFVVWWVNMIEGGCHNGSYTSDFDKAWAEFQSRAGRLN